MPYPIGDINQDGVVDSIDLSLLVSNWNTSDSASDLNNDGIVDSLDLSILVSNWGEVSSPGYEAVDITSVQANGDDGNNIAENTIDEDFDTRWSYNQIPAILTLDLGLSTSIGAVQVAWYNGDQRIFSFSIEVSENDTDWTQVYNGSSSGTTNSFEMYDFPDTSARYVRLLVYGNDLSGVEEWTSISQIQVVGPTGAGDNGSAPEALENISAIASDGSITLTWDDVLGATSYNIERSEQSTGPWSTVSGDTQSPYTDSPLSNGTTYYYRIRSQNPAGESDWSEHVSATPVEDTGQNGNGLTAEPTRDELIAAGASQARLLIYGYDGTSRPNNNFNIPTGFRHGGNTGIELHGLTDADLSPAPTTINNGDTVYRRHFTSEHQLQADDVTYVQCKFEANVSPAVINHNSNTPLHLRNTFIDCEIRNTAGPTDPDPANAFRHTHQNTTYQQPGNSHTFVRCNLYGGETVVYMLGYVNFYECFIHDPVTVSEGHWDGIQSNRGEFEILGTTSMARWQSVTYALNIESAQFHSAQVHNARIENVFIAGGSASLALYWRSATWNGAGGGHIIRNVLCQTGSQSLTPISFHDSTATGGPSSPYETAVTGDDGADWIVEHLWETNGNSVNRTAQNGSWSWDGTGQQPPDWSNRPRYDLDY